MRVTVFGASRVVNDSTVNWSAALNICHNNWTNGGLLES